MQLFRSSRGGDERLLAYRQLREAGLVSAQSAQRHLQFPESFVHSLCEEHVLRGHMGCVNRLAWNREGTLLASGSDDRQIMLWRYPDAQQPPICVDTLHQANIFGVAFLPGRGDRSLISGAMDFSVQLHHLDHSPTVPRAAAREPPDRLAVLEGRFGRMVRHEPSQSVGANTTIYNCHKGRVKMVEVEPENPHMFWSASEDGTVRQFDTRCANQADYESPNVLLAVRQKTRLLDLLAVSINKVRPYQMAIASSDPYVRVYDRRMLATGTPDSAAVLAEPVLRMAPPHMCLVNLRKNTRSNTTHVAFGARGDKLIASYHADHAYSFDISGAADDCLAAAFLAQSPAAPAPAPSMQPLFTAAGFMPRVRPTDPYTRSSSGGSVLPEHAEAAKNEGNRAFFDMDDNTAIWHYTQAIRLAPSSALLYANRAAAYLKRDWVSDSWAALQDCETAICLDPMFVKAHCRRVHALNAQGQLHAANQAALTFAQQFPGNLEDIARLHKSITDELDARRAKAESLASKRAAARERRSAALSRSHSDPQPASQSGEEEPRGVAAEACPMDETSDDSSSVASDNGAAPTRDREGWLRDDERMRSGAEASTSRGGHGNELRFGDPMVAGEVQRLLQRFIGHCNVQTDIKEATFMGANDELVAAGSDDGRVFIYDAATGYPIRALQADEDVANCVQPHPSLPVLATSGIENVVRLWRPGDAKEPPNQRAMMALVSHNQERLKNGTNIFRTVNPRVLAALTHNPELLNILLDRARAPAEAEQTTGPQQQEVTCRMS